jgi:hypothetical protein
MPARPSRRARRVAEARDQVLGDGQRLDAVRLVRVPADPDARFEPLDRQGVVVAQQAVADVEAGAAELRTVLSIRTSSPKAQGTRKVARVSTMGKPTTS